MSLNAEPILFSLYSVKCCPTQGAPLNIHDFQQKRKLLHNKTY
jgi:hypothetical protein